MEHTMLYFTCFIVGLLGMILQVLIKINSLNIKSKKANLAFHVKDYFASDWLSLAASITTIVLTLFLIDEVFNWNPKLVDYIKWVFAFVGYTGSDIMTRIFGMMNKQINSAIDYKTTIADTSTGTTETPTPIK